MSDSNTNSLFNLTCFVQGDPIVNNFLVQVSLTTMIRELAHKIVQAYNHSCFGRKLVSDNTLISLYQVDATYREVSKLGTPSEEHAMFGADQVQDYWPDPEKIPRRHVQVLVIVQVISPAQHHPADVSQLTSDLDGLTLRQDSVAQGFWAAPSASDAAHHSTFQKQQEKSEIPIYNGRPYERTDIPIQLFHQAFDFFTTELMNNDEPDADKYSAVEEFMFSSQATEPVCWSVTNGLLVGALGHPVTGDAISKCESDGVVAFTERNSSQKAYAAVVTVENETGTGDSDPWVQGAQLYARYWSQIAMTGLRKATPCPCFIISIAGPWMCISGAVYLDRVVVQPLTDYVWLGKHPQQDHHLMRVTRLFLALERAISFLHGYYSPLIKPGVKLSIERRRDSPYIRSVMTSTGKVDLTYTGRVGDSGAIRPVFEAMTEDGRPVVVKFAQFYNFKAHQLLAAQSLAPQLLSVEAEQVGGGLVMVVMELSGKSLDNYLGSTGLGLELSARAQVCEDVKAALDLLHANDLVFGDLRPPNVLVVEKDGSLHGQLIDFEWCGIEGKARYPAGMNESQSIGWAPDAKKRQPLRKQHDDYMFNKLFL
ncbi:hypothetical protein RSOLAG22IIIB_04996 [Rhizoctonia solani]|uniref:Protein kinase domain-containing protein n=1 Tax=Rhizoctonia solani TaxID=456999 RepID=A0A0K6G2D7_9AGAM|nr:hypothetical protein RSOLAG22IIIB_04996 [Rhizoctonia solani]